MTAGDVAGLKVAGARRSPALIERRYS